MTSIDQIHRRTALATVWLLLAMLLMGCGTAAQAPTAATPPKEIKVQLAWLDSIEYSGFYMAQDQGFYAEENLNVTLLPFTRRDLLPIDEVVEGRADFAINSIDRILLAREAGKPIVGIGAIYQRSPVTFYSLAEKNITRPKDMIGHRAQIDPFGTTAIIWTALLAAQNIDPTSMDIQKRTDFSDTPLLNGETDIVAGYINNQPVQLELEGHDLNLIIASDYGIDIYSNVIFTSEALANQDPETVERFLRATTRGIQYAVDHPEEAAQAAIARKADLNLERETQSMLRGLPLFNPAGSTPGMMKPETWAQAHELMLEQGLLKQPIDISAAYTMKFLHAVYAKQ